MTVPTQLQDPPNPWFQILIRPRQTIDLILATDPKRHVRLLSILGGGAIMIVLQDGHFWPLGPLGGLAGLLAVPVLAVFLQFAGRVLGGNGSRVAIRAAVAWSLLPLIYFAASEWVLEMGYHMGTEYWWYFVPFVVLLLPLFRTPLNCLSEVMKLSLPRTLVAIVISAVLFYGAVVMLAPVVEDVVWALWPFDPDNLSELVVRWLMSLDVPF